MKTIYPAAGGLLLVAALLLAFKGCGDPGPAADDGAAGTNGGKVEAADKASAHHRPRPAPRPAVRESETSAAARELQLLWARGRASELLPALDRLSATADSERWGEVAPVLIEQAAKEGRPDVATYLLATGDAAPAGIRLEIYAAALDNRDEGIRDVARLELQNITGEIFPSGEAVREWLAANPQATREDDEDQ